MKMLVLGKWNNVEGPQVIKTWNGSDQADTVVRIALAGEYMNTAQVCKMYSSDAFQMFGLVFSAVNDDGVSVYSDDYSGDRLCLCLTEEYSDYMYYQLLSVMRKVQTINRMVGLQEDLLDKYIHIHPDPRPEVTISYQYPSTQLPKEFQAKCLSAHLTYRRTLIVGYDSTVRAKVVNMLNRFTQTYHHSLTYCRDAQLQALRSCSIDENFKTEVEHPMVIIDLDRFQVQCTMTELQGFYSQRDSYQDLMLEYQISHQLGQTAIKPVCPVNFQDYRSGSKLVVDFLRVYFELPSELQEPHIDQFMKHMQLKGQILDLYIQQQEPAEKRYSEHSSLPSTRPTPDTSPKLRPYTAISPQTVGTFDLDMSTRSTRTISRNSMALPAFLTQLWPNGQLQRKPVLQNALDLIMDGSSVQKRPKSTDHLSQYMTLRLPPKKNSALQVSSTYGKLNDPDLNMVLSFAAPKSRSKLQTLK